MTEAEKMVAGLPYFPGDKELGAKRKAARELLRKMNVEGVDPDEVTRELFGSRGEEVWIEPPFFCDYGDNIHVGTRVCFNFNCVVLDPAKVTIGDDFMCGPNVQIYTPTHPMDPEERATWTESAKEIKIGSKVWIGGGAIICPGVTIGDGAVIGAGSVVTRDIPARVFAAGNPCKVIREV